MVFKKTVVACILHSSLSTRMNVVGTLPIMNKKLFY